MSIIRNAAVLATTCATAALLSTAALAQQVYRIVGPDGKVTFSDRAPAANAEGTAVGAGPRSGGSGAEALPYALRQVATRFPVTLYTSSDCVPCPPVISLRSRASSASRSGLTCSSESTNTR